MFHSSSTSNRSPLTNPERHSCRTKVFSSAPNYTSRLQHRLEVSMILVWPLFSFLFARACAPHWASLSTQAGAGSGPDLPPKDPRVRGSTSLMALLQLFFWQQNNTNNVGMPTSFPVPSTFHPIPSPSPSPAPSPLFSSSVFCLLLSPSLSLSLALGR